MKKKILVIFGTGKHALLVLNEVISEYNFNQIFFFNDKEKKKIFEKRNKKIFYH